MQCPLCGLSFSQWEGQSVCRRCPLAHGCSLTRCPGCGYEWAEESRLVSWFQRRLHHWRATHRDREGTSQR